MLAAVFLTAPLLSAWAWHNSNDAPSDQKSEPKTTRVPVEIIPSDNPPKWVLVPIDPS
jgi:hypothetical protein